MLAAAVAVAFAPPGGVGAPFVAVGCFPIAAPPAYVFARADPADRDGRLPAYVVVWIAGGFVGVAALRARALPVPGVGDVGAGGLLLFVGPGAWLAAAAALRVDPRGLVRLGAVVAAATALGLGGGHVLGPRLGAGWPPEAGSAAGLFAGAAVYRRVDARRRAER